MATQAAPVYDRVRINDALVSILSEQNRWRYYLARNSIAYLHLVYEDVVQSPQQAVEAVGRLVGLADQPRIDLSLVRLEVQRDGVSEEWRDRYIGESRDLGRFD